MHSSSMNQDKVITSSDADSMEEEKVELSLWLVQYKFQEHIRKFSIR